MSNDIGLDAAGDNKEGNNRGGAPLSDAEAAAVVSKVMEGISTERGVPAFVPATVTLALEARELSLTPKQETALILLAAAHSRVEVAHGAGVTRQTLHRWITKDAAFSVAYNTWLEDSLATTRARVVNGLGTAAETVLRAIRTDAKLAYKLLADAGVTKPQSGALCVEELATELELAARRKKVEQQAEKDRLESAEFHRLVGMRGVSEEKMKG